MNSSREEFCIALVGNPNCGKSAIFNQLTGGRAKVGNYSGVTVEKKTGFLRDKELSSARLIDLPGTFSLDQTSLDEQVTTEVLLGQRKDETAPDLILAVIDSTQISRGLNLVLELKRLGKPMVLALNMTDLALKKGLEFDLNKLEQALEIPVVSTIAVKKGGLQPLLDLLKSQLPELRKKPLSENQPLATLQDTPEEIRRRFQKVDEIVAQVQRASEKNSPSDQLSADTADIWSDRIDRVVLHPVWGSLLLVLVLGLVFQAIFAWAKVPMEWIEAQIGSLGIWVGSLLSDGPLKSLLVEGVISGVGSVIVFLPQILLLFLFILFLEDFGYLPRAAFLMDRLMSRVGLHGRAFIPLLSSFACAIPGIMAARTIESRKDRLVTILIAPLMTCSARLPVYSLLIAAVVPNQEVVFGLGLQGLVLLGLYLFGIVGALVVAVTLKKTILKGEGEALMLELPSYKWPSFKSIAAGLFDRAKLFLKRAGTVILSATVILWFLVSYPKPQTTVSTPIAQSYAGQVGHAVEPLLKPIGFDWKIAVALIPGLAAREVMVSSLATVYAVEEEEAEEAPLLVSKIAQEWSVATGLSLLMWYVFASQCFSTLAVTRRETNSLKWPTFMFVYMTVLAYSASFLTYQFAISMGWG